MPRPNPHAILGVAACLLAFAAIVLGFAFA